MKAVVALGLLSLVLEVSVVGNDISDLTYGKVSRYKKQINYSSIVNRIPPEEVIVVDWSSILKEPIHAGGDDWLCDEPGDLSVSKGVGSLSCAMESKVGETVALSVHNFSGGRDAAIESALAAVASASEPIISAEVADSFPGDFSLVNRVDEAIPQSSFVYGNINIELVHQNVEGDITPLAEYFQQMMTTAVKSNPTGSRPEKPSVRYAVSTRNPSVGTTFSVTVEPQGAAADSVGIGFCEESAPDAVEFGGREEGRYVFRAITPGAADLEFVVMDKRTLSVFEDKISVQISSD